MRFCQEGSFSAAWREYAQSHYHVHLAPSPDWVARPPQEAGLVVDLNS